MYADAASMSFAGHHAAAPRMMTRRPSLRELLGVWLAGAVGEVLAFDLVEGAGAALTAEVLAVGFMFFLIPLFLVVYSLIWAWPLAAIGDRAAVSALLVFVVVVEAVSAWFWVAVDTITLTTVVMRLLAVLTPVVFAACAASAVWAYRRHGRPTALAPPAVSPPDPPIARTPGP